ncbi:MAG: protein-methionine-sulfoxide reductase heme-binding subunit MsrQ [Myxococcota bacterium]|jgi:sulfoxide reductase heme-binding subunit YedZ|nr:protein-methionine-sulfoxide reductase heme-binding subunit MsrQ [Myxococcota bacterium]
MAAALVRFGIPIFGALPLLGLTIAFFLDELGADPVEKVTHETGEWALRLLLLTLLVTPLRRFAGWSWLAPHRRTLGLYSFLYAALHFATYLVFDLGFDFTFLGEDIAERPYITVGFASFVILFALAATSSKGAIKQLKKRWTALHRLVYVAAIGGVVHFLWLVKADLREPLVYGAVLAAILAARAPWNRIIRR